MEFFFQIVSPCCHCNLPFHLMKMSLLKYLAKIYKAMFSVVTEKSSLKIMSLLPSSIALFDLNCILNKK